MNIFHKYQDRELHSLTHSEESQKLQWESVEREKQAKSRYGTPHSEAVLKLKTAFQRYDTSVE